MSMVERLKRLNGRAAPLKEVDANDPVARGQEAWKRLKTAGRQTWDDWKQVGAALMAGRLHALDAAKTTTPTGKAYNQAFHYWLQTRRLDEIDKSDRSKLLLIMGNLDGIEKWLAKKTEAERASWNHPSTVWRVSRCKDRGIEAVNKKTEAPVPNPGDLPQPAAEFEEENKELAWQRGLAQRLRRVIGDVKLNDHWLLPEPPDQGLIAVADELIRAATSLRDYLKWAHEATPEELAEGCKPKKPRSRQEAEPALAGAN
jgi:hypothetical protein